MSLEFTQCLTDMCVYWKQDDTRLIVVGVYVDDLLVTATASSLIDMFFADLNNLSVKNLGIAHKFLGMRIKHDDENGYDIDQEVTIVDMLKDLGLENARGTRTPMDDTNYDVVENNIVLPTYATPDGIPVRKFQSLVGSLLWISRCTRPTILFAVHRAT